MSTLRDRLGRYGIMAVATLGTLLGGCRAVAQPIPDPANKDKTLLEMIDWQQPAARYQPYRDGREYVNGIISSEVRLPDNLSSRIGYEMLASQYAELKKLGENRVAASKELTGPEGLDSSLNWLSTYGLGEQIRTLLEQKYDLALQNLDTTRKYNFNKRAQLREIYRQRGQKISDQELAKLIPNVSFTNVVGAPNTLFNLTDFSYRLGAGSEAGRSLGRVVGFTAEVYELIAESKAKISDSGGLNPVTDRTQARSNAAPSFKGISSLRGRIASSTPVSRNSYLTENQHRFIQHGMLSEIVELAAKMETAPQISLSPEREFGVINNLNDPNWERSALGPGKAYLRSLMLTSYLQGLSVQERTQNPALAELRQHALVAQNEMVALDIEIARVPGSDAPLYTGNTPDTDSLRPQSPWRTGGWRRPLPESRYAPPAEELPGGR